MLGLPDEACREARDRVRAAVLSSGLNWPDQKITVNLAPPHHRKTGSGLDLPIALGVLLATQQLPVEALATTCALGELGLDGSIRPIPGTAPMVGVHPDADWIVPEGGVSEARLVTTGRVRSALSLRTLVDALAGIGEWSSGPPPGTLSLEDDGGSGKSTGGNITWNERTDSRWGNAGDVR